MTSRLEQDLSCPVCCELFRDPVVLTCSHSFCKVCLENWWKDKALKTCPVCKRRSSKENLPLNLALRNLVQTFTEVKISPEQPECSVHSEKLRLFCLDHQELVCLVCRDSRTHTGHSFRPIEEVAQDLREQLRTDIRPLQDKLKVLDQSRAQLDSAAAHISAQARHTQTQIKAQFDKLHQFLREEEDSRMKTLREEEQQKTQKMKEQMATVSRAMEALSQTISETEEQLRAADISFLLQYKAAAERVQRCPLVEEPQMEPGALIDQAKHLGNLGFNIWRSMKSQVHFYPVLLDPNTVGSDQVLSEDLSSVRRGERQKVPQNPERCQRYTVKGSEEFTFGTNSWDLEVGENTDWEVGVKTVVRLQFTDDWCISFKNGQYFSGSYQLPPVKKLQRVRVTLDLRTRTLTFTDPDTDTLLLSRKMISGKTIGEKIVSRTRLFPYISTSDDIPLKILPKDVTVNI